MIKTVALIGTLVLLSVPAMAHETCPAVGDPVLMGNGQQNGTATVSLADHLLCEQNELKRIEKVLDAYLASWNSYRVIYQYPYYPYYYSQRHYIPSKAGITKSRTGRKYMRKRNR